MNGHKQESSKTFVVFGATGDLSYRKLMPAFYNMFCNHRLDDTNVIAIGRRDYSSEDYHQIIHDWVVRQARFAVDEQKFHEFCKKITYFKMDLSDINEYVKLKEVLNQNHIYMVYMAVSPVFFDVIVEGIHQLHLSNVRMIMEKPFGTDLESAKKLQAKITSYFQEKNIFRIDHYVGKDMVRNILTIVTANPMFHATWNNQYIDHINIFALEEVGVEDRASYYDKTGAMKDMVQNHLFQLLSIVCAARPEHLDTLFIDQQEVLDSLEFDPNSLVLGQYDGYLQEKNIDPKSQTETFAKFTVNVNTPKFNGVPIHIITGKKMRYKDTSIQVVYKSQNGLANNVLTLKVQPKEGIEVSFHVKPNAKNMAQFDYCQNCIDQTMRNTPESYERMLMEIQDGDNTWFSKWKQIEKSWEFMEHIHTLEKHIVTYQPYGYGPDGALSQEIIETLEKPFVCNVV